MRDYRQFLRLCLRARRQATAAFCYAVLHHVPVTVYEAQ
jgi:hypothetical protein